MGFLELFPYEPRFQQERIMTDILASVDGQGHLVMESGTGTGKTICALAPCIDYALRNGKRLLYLTHTNAQQRQVLLELSRINDRRRVFGAGIQGRRSMCPLIVGDAELHGGSPDELSRLCSDRKRRVLKALGQGKKGKACPFYANLVKEPPTAIIEWMKQELPTPEEVLERCTAAELCPYELTKLAVKEATMVTAPYVYFFNTFIRQALLEWMGCALEDIVLIVDEAHNLPEFGRELESFDLSLYSLQLAEKEAAERDDPEVGDGLEASALCGLMRDILVGLADEYAKDREDALVPPYEVRTELMHATSMTSKTLEGVFANLMHLGESIKEERQDSGRLPRSYLGHFGEFLTFWNRLDGDTHIKLVHGGDNPNLEAYCLDPSLATQVVNAVHSSVHMSGTLKPLDEYRDSIGLPASSETKAYPSPFPPANLLLLYSPDVTTRYEDLQRDPRLIERMARHIREICAGTDRNTIVFFPSYSMLDRFIDMERAFPSGRRVFIEQRDLTQGELATLVKDFKEQSGVLYSVVGGRVSEGTDFPGGELEIVVMAGIPYPKPTAKQRALQYYYDVKFGKGWDYAVKAPTTRKLLQSIGRIIRSESDVGAAIVLDHRAVHFSDSLPELMESSDLASDISGFFGDTKP